LNTIRINLLSNFCILLSFFLFSCGSNSNKEESTNATKKPQEVIPVIFYTLVDSFPHDTTLFTEGLLFHEDKLFESSGAPQELDYAKSVVGSVELPSGIFNKKIEIDREKYFGEGIVIVNNKLYQLTYKNQTCFVYDLKSFKQIGEFKYPNDEGWGLTTDGKSIIMSDGTSTINFINSNTFVTERKITVTNNGEVVNNINELEYINGSIYANIWTTNNIVKIDPTSGKITGILDLSSLKRAANSSHKMSAETNGIAFDSTSNLLLVTGKLWPYYYQIRLPN